MEERNENNRKHVIKYIENPRKGWIGKYNEI